MTNFFRVQPMERFKRSVPYAYRRFDKETYYNVISREYNTCFSQVNRSYRNLKRYRQYRNRPNKDTDKFVEFRRNNRRRYKLVDRIVSLAKSGTINPTSEEIIEIPTTTEMPSKCNDLIPELTPEQIDTYMIEMRMINFSFQLMDFADNDYRCIDPETNNEYRFGDVVACMVKRAEIPVNPPKNPPMDTTTEEARTVPPVEGPRTDFVRDQLQIGIYMLLGAMLLMTLATIIFFKKKKIKYFLILFRNFLILACTSEPDSDKNLLVQKEEKRKHNLKTQKMDDSFTYDVFVSYSDKDRSWVLDELLPNIEKRSTINVCLHERDFQVTQS